MLIVLCLFPSCAAEFAPCCRRFDIACPLCVCVCAIVTLAAGVMPQMRMGGIVPSDPGCRVVAFACPEAVARLQGPICGVQWPHLRCCALFFARRNSFPQWAQGKTGLGVSECSS